MKKLLIGNAAVARGAYEAGVSVVSSYPGTPSTEITESMVQYSEVQVEWAPNEKVAAEVSIGASMAGARAMSCMKHVGMNVCADPLFTVSYSGVNGGLVFCVGVAVANTTATSDACEVAALLAGAREAKAELQATADQ